MDTNKNYISRAYHTDDEDQIVPLLKLVFGDWPKYDFQGTATDHWRWKFLDFPLKYISTVVAESHGKIIGVSHGIPLRIKIGDKRLIGQKGADVAVHPNYRGMGVYTNNHQFKLKMLGNYGCHFGYSLTANPILIESTKRRRRKGDITRPFPHPIIYLVRIQDIDKHLLNNEYDRPDTVMKLGYLGTKALSKLGSKKKIKDQGDFNITETSLFGDEINEFWDQVKDGYDFIVEKSMNYLNWRYCDPRGGIYQVLLAKDIDQILGFIVIKVNRYRDEYPVGYIMEVLALLDRNDVVDALIGEVVDRFDSLNVNIVHGQVVKGHPYEELFKRHGFVDSRTKPILNYRPIDLGDVFGVFVNSSPDRLHYQYGESDSV